MTFIPIVIFVFGAIVGSFLNVIVFRLNTGRGVVRGRSRCDRCDRHLSCFELVPVFSFLALRGKCRTCKADLSFDHPFIELLTAIVFTLLYSRFVVEGGFTVVAWATFLFSLIITGIFIVITVYDLKHKIIPNQCVYPLIALSLLSLFWSSDVGFVIPGVQQILSGPYLAAPFFLLWFFSQGKAMGFGDVKLALGIGWLVGGAMSLSVFVLSFWIGAIVGLFLIALTRSHTMRTQVPFAPFFILALAIVVLWRIDITQLLFVW